MPLYEYECEACGHRFETIQKFSDPPVEKCPKCGGRVHKLQAAPAFQFKGSGWYITDYAKKSGSSASSDASPEKAEPSPKTDQPAAKADAAASEKGSSTPSTKKDS